MSRSPSARLVRERNDDWFRVREWTPFDFQRETWEAIGAGRSGLLHATTGAGKTYAVWFGALAAFAAPDAPGPVPLTVLWVTPMRALAADTARTLEAPLAQLGLRWTVALRTGDTAAAERARQAAQLPSALVTTPESLSLALSRPDARERLARVAMVVVDEWHELIGSKRGVQTQLALARLRGWNPQLVTWGLSATLGNLDEALDVLVPRRPADPVVQVSSDAAAEAPPLAATTVPSAARPRNAAHAEPTIRAPLLVRGALPKALTIDTIIPREIERFPWAGHLGMKLLPDVVAGIEEAGTTLLFTNTRSQAELWYQALIDARPDWAGLVALHHGSLDRKLRDWVELGLKEGRLKAVVCTSSLDLGVDFLPVERVLQLGSPKGVARLLQRAGRSGHSPGRLSRVTCVPTHAFELIEAAAARRAAAAGTIEARRPPRKPLDVLVQHLVTVALGGGFAPDALLAELRSTHAYRELDDAEFRWALDFVTRGGGALAAYPEYRRVLADETGMQVVRDAAIAKRHRMSIGTIVSDAAMEVRYIGGQRIGTVEESFVARLHRGDCFLFGGRLLELVRVHEMSAFVRKAKPGKRTVPRWQGSKMPLSSELAEAVLDELRRAVELHRAPPEMQALAPLLAVQARWSRVPDAEELLVELVHTREGHHCFCFPFAGRSVHIGLASLVAWRVSRDRGATFSISVNDYGFELLGAEPIDWEHAMSEGALAATHLEDDLLASLNAGELARRRFREIARIAGLVFQGYPGERRSTRHLQASSELFFDVFTKHDPQNLLLRQARREVLEQELELSRMRRCLDGLATRTLRITRPRYPTPFAFPLLADRMREKLSTEKAADRVLRLSRQLDAAADRPSVPPRRARPPGQAFR
jgi:ATP-dependent Lhr-like helicase